MSQLAGLREQAIALRKDLDSTFARYQGLTLPDAVMAEVRTKTATLNALADRIEAMLPDAPPASRFLIPGSGGGTSADGVRVLRPDEPLSGTKSGPSMAAYLKGVVLGDWRGMDPALKTMSVGTTTAGGFLVPTPLSANVIDKARNLATVMRAGALTVPMDSATLKIARVAGDPTAGWKSENAAATASDMVLEQVTLTARTLMAYVKTSVELIEDGTEVDGTIENALAAALALELDRAVLRGSGTPPEPKGIKNQTNVNVTGSVGSPSSYIAFADTPTRTLREANAAEPYAFISSPRTFTSLGSLVSGISGDKTRLVPPPAWDAFAKFSTNQIPINLGAGTNESEAYIGDFSQVLVGIRSDLVIEASREATAGSDNAWAQLQVHIRAYMRADVALLHPEHFVVLSGILA